jgi:dTDP-glucose 4,6-dehydratase
MVQIKKILVTGGAGFIGSNFIRYMYNKYPEYEIINLDFLTYAGNLDNLLEIEKAESKKKNRDKRYHFIQGDICDIVLVEKILKKYKPDIIVNFAAESHVDRSIMDSRYFFRTNLVGVHNLVDLVIKYDIPRFVQISTDEVYGDVLKGQSNELSQFKPSNPYAASKAAADLLVQSYIRTHKLPVLILRGSNNFGPYQYPEKLIPLAITNLLERKKVPIHGTGLQRRRWLYVDDFSNAIDLALHNAPDFSIYNVAGVEMANIDIIKIIANVLGKDYLKIVSFINDRPGGDMRYAPDAAKIKKELGWKLEHTPSNQLAEVVKWYRDNMHWWKKIKSKKEFSIRYQKQYKAEY